MDKNKAQKLLDQIKSGNARSRAQWTAIAIEALEAVIALSPAEAPKSPDFSEPTKYTPKRKKTSSESSSQNNSTEE